MSNARENQIKLSQVTDVKAFGATGDGSTNDAAAIQAAIDSLTDGGLVLFPYGVYVVNTGLTVPGGVTLRGEARGRKYSAFTSFTGTVIRAGTSMATLVTTDENASDLGCAVIEDLILDGNNVATTVLKMQGVKDTLRNADVVRGGSYGVVNNVTGVAHQTIENVQITMDSRGVGWHIASGSDSNFTNVIVNGGYRDMLVEAGGHQFDRIHLAPSPLDAGDASHVCLLDINSTGDNYFVNCHFDQIHTANQYQVKIRCDTSSALENIFVGCSFDNPDCDVATVSGVFLDASTGYASNYWITAHFHACNFSGNGTNKYEYAFEKVATGNGYIQYYVMGGQVNNATALWSHAPNAYSGVAHISGGHTVVADPITGSDGDLSVGADLTVAGKVVLTTGSELTIATGAITVTASHHTVDTEGDAASDDLDTISGGTDGMMLVLRAADSARTVVLKDAVDNLQLAGDCTLDNAQDTITLMYSGTNWREISRSDNGA